MIDLRWKEWEPWMAIVARKLNGRTPLVHLKYCHCSRMRALLDAGVSWKAIRHGQLDDPLLNTDEFQITLRAAIERRRTRLGRIKGVRHDHR